MIIHQREFGYKANYSEVFEALVEAKAHVEKKYPEISLELSTIWQDREVTRRFRHDMLRWPTTNESMLN
jgi:hypothetical protein